MFLNELFRMEPKEMILTLLVMAGISSVVGLIARLVFKRSFLLSFIGCFVITPIPVLLILLFYGNRYSVSGNIDWDEVEKERRAKWESDLETELKYHHISKIEDGYYDTYV